MNPSLTHVQRRRTQIRLAQRAYRNRKETAIQTLEKKVNVLQDTNEEMSKAFMNLYDTAVSQGLLSAAPEFGRQLQATTEKFVALARKMSDDASSRDADQAPENESDGVNTGSSSTSAQNATRFSSSPEISSWPSQPPGVLSSGPSAATAAAGSSEATGVNSNRRGSAVSGTHSTHEVRNESSTPRREPNPADPVPFGYQFPNVASRPSDARTIVERVSRPLSGNNTSYPFGTSLDARNPGSLLDPSVPYAVAASPLPPFIVPPVPQSYSYLERTFGRRMQRAALEQALVLLNMPSPPPHVFGAVFGFCLLFEPRDKIVKRVTDCLSRNNGQTLHNWKFPFFHLGGAGSFFNLMNHATDYSDIPTPDITSSSGDGASNPSSSSSSSSSRQIPVGNQGTQGPHKPSRGVNFSMGPFERPVEDAREMRMDDRLRMKFPGFQGDFFDPDEIEFFFRQKGVYIPPASDFVTVEIDPNDFTLESVLAAATEMIMDPIYGDMAFPDVDLGTNSNTRAPPTTSMFDSAPNPTTTTAASSVSLSHLIDPLLTNQFSEPANNSPEVPRPTFGDINFGDIPLTDPFVASGTGQATKQKLSLNIDKLVTG